MKRIGIDCRFAGSHSGLGRYTRELTLALCAREDAVQYVLFVANTEEVWQASLPEGTERIQAPYAHYSFAEQLFFPFVLRRAQLDLLFVPHFNVPLFCPVPTAITVHDLILHRYPNQASLFKRLAYRLVLWSAVRRARCICTVSDFTARELCDVYGKDLQAKTQTVYPGVGPEFAPQDHTTCTAVREKYGLKNDFFLYVGNAKEHKNVQFLLDCYAESGVSEDLILICGGKEADALRLSSGVRRLQDVEDADLPALYSASVATVTASLYEGFGLPMAEASACKTRVIGTNCAAIPESAGQNACLVDPESSAMVHALQHVHDLLPAQPKHDFSWYEAAKSIADILQKL